MNEFFGRDRCGFRVTALLLLGMASAPGWGQCCQNCPEKRLLAVYGTGTATADADLAVVRVGYKLYGPDVKTLYGEASRTSTAIMEALISSGIPASAVESSSQALQPTPPYELQQVAVGSQERLMKQFTLTQSWAVRVKPDNAAKALNTAVNAGANSSGWIEWTVQNPSALHAEASANAVEEARRVADRMAEKSGVHIGSVVSMTENQNFGELQGGVVGGIAGMPYGNGAATGGPLPLAINSRRVEYRVTIYVSYSIS